MSRVLAVDFGERRIGIALSDPTRTIASPLTTLPRKEGKRPPWPQIRQIVEEQEVDALVVGLPLTLEGEESDWTREVRAFGADAERRLGLPVAWIDERMTSVLAERAVRGMGLKKSDREQKERVDAAAAAMILRAYLEQGGRERHEVG